MSGTFASFEASGSFTDRGTEGIAAWWNMPSASGKESHLTVLPLRPPGPPRLHQEVEVGDAPLNERHPGMAEEVLNVHPPPGGEVVDDNDVVILRQGIREVGADEAGAAGDDVTHE